MTDPDPREGVDPANPGGLIEGGPADIPGLQDRSVADAAAKAEQAEQPEQPEQTEPPQPATGRPADTGDQR